MKHIQLVKLIEDQVRQEWKYEKFLSKKPLLLSKALMYISAWLFLSSIIGMFSAIEKDELSSFSPDLLMEILVAAYFSIMLSKLILLVRRFQISKEYKDKYQEKDVNTAYARKVFNDLNIDIQKLKLNERDLKYATEYFLMKSHSNFISRLYIEPIQTFAITVALVIGAFSIGPFNNNVIGGYDCKPDSSQHYSLRCWDRKELTEKTYDLERRNSVSLNETIHRLNNKFLFLLMLAYFMLIFSLNNKKFIQTKIILNMVSYDSFNPPS